MSPLDREEILRTLKRNLKESEEAPFFSDEELIEFFEYFESDMRLATYKLLIMKSENDSIGYNGTKMADNSEYWLRRASLFAPIRSRVL